MPRATMEVGWGDYLLFWAFNIVYGILAANLAIHGGVLFTVGVLVFGYICYLYAEFILDFGG